MLGWNTRLLVSSVEQVICHVLTGCNLNTISIMTPRPICKITTLRWSLCEAFLSKALSDQADETVKHPPNYVHISRRFTAKNMSIHTLHSAYNTPLTALIRSCTPCKFHPLGEALLQPFERIKLRLESLHGLCQAPYRVPGKREYEEQDDA